MVSSLTALDIEENKIKSLDTRDDGIRPYKIIVQGCGLLSQFLPFG